MLRSSRTLGTKPEIALAEIDRMIAARVHFGCVLADAGYGLSAPFRQGLTRRVAWLGPLASLAISRCTPSTSLTRTAALGDWPDQLPR